MPPRNPLRIAITPGEPAGIGVDLCVQLAQHSSAEELIVVTDPLLLEQRAHQLNLPLKLISFNPNSTPTPQTAGGLKILPVALEAPVAAGQLNTANAPYVLNTLRLAAENCLNKSFSALVTGPIHKGIINDAGIFFTGHTEYLANLTDADPVMMLSTPGLRVALVTTHLPLSAVSTAITCQKLEKTIRILHHDLQVYFGIVQPRILVCGLNPHAGENGHLGREEITVISPTLDKLRTEGITLNGPLPADTLFTKKYLEQSDAVLAMYHDQGLPVLKHMGFGRATNITLGLPFIRTSVDHGTALELAGTGEGSCTSLKVALATAVQMAAFR